jgi:flagellar biosynthesis protein FlhG
VAIFDDAENKNGVDTGADAGEKSPTSSISQKNEMISDFVAVSNETEKIEKPAETGNIREVSVAKRAKIWAVGGGKGGVGKSLISANFALSLARRGRSVIALDLDLGGSNLHTCLGVEPPRLGIGDWAAGRNDDIKSVMNQVAPGLKMISGSTDQIQITELMQNRRKDLANMIRGLEADDVILDLGAGTHEFTIEFFNLADEGILSILPEPTSVENAYRFIKAAFYYRLKQADVSAGIKEVIDAAMDQKNILGIRSPNDLFAIVDRLDSQAATLMRQQVMALTPSIVINQVRSQVDIDVGRAICSVCRRYFGMELKYAGYIDYDNSVWKAIRSKKAVILEYPYSVLANRIEHLTKALLGEEKGLFP